MAKRGLGINLKDLDLIEKNLTVLHDYILLRTLRTIAVIVVDVLAHSLPRTPYDTGELRASGRAIIKTSMGQQFTVGRASNVFPHETVNADLGKINTGKVKGLRRKGIIKGDVTFRRMNESGVDIATWAHETLLPYVPRPKPPELQGIPVATKPNTGPKYLELAWNERVHEYRNLLDNILNPADVISDIQGITKIRSRKKTKYSVDVVELVHSQLNTIGWNKIAISGQFFKD